MEKKFYEEKKDDYYDLFETLGDLLDRFSDYTPDREKELETVISECCDGAADLPEGPRLFRILKAYIIYRSVEMREYEAKRKEAERKFIGDLHNIFDTLSLPDEDSCEKLVEFEKKHKTPTNYQVLVDGLLKVIASL